MNLAGRSAIITGANQGLGRAVAMSFVQAGASVLLTARNEELLQQTVAELRPLAVQPGQGVHGMRGDVSRPESCGAVVQQAMKLFSEITILVNNAGIYGPLGPVQEVDWDQWVETIEINLFGTVLMSRALIPHLRARNYGKIVNLSGGGATSPLPRFSAYAAAKAAVVRFTETLCEELRDARIDVNAVAPGALNTRLLDEVLAAGPDKVGKAFFERSLTQREQGGVPLDKGAKLIVFLASAASDGISGRLLSAVWDDWASLPSKRAQLAASDMYTLRRITPEDRGMKW